MHQLPPCETFSCCHSVIVYPSTHDSSSCSPLWHLVQFLNPKAWNEIKKYIFLLSKEVPQQEVTDTGNNQFKKCISEKREKWKYFVIDKFKYHETLVVFKSFVTRDCARAKISVGNKRSRQRCINYGLCKYSRCLPPVVTLCWNSGFPIMQCATWFSAAILAPFPRRFESALSTSLIVFLPVFYMPKVHLTSSAMSRYFCFVESWKIISWMWSCEENFESSWNDFVEAA